MARRVHGLLLVLSGAAMTACVIPPPLEVEEQADAGLNSPPVIIGALDGALSSLRPPATLTVNRHPAVTPFDITLTLYDLDVEDELTVKMFVDYDPASPLPARVTCTVPSSTSATRGYECTTSGLCTASDVGTPEPHRLEIEVYDQRPLDVAPFRTPPPGALFSTWTIDLICIEVAPS